MKNIKNNIKLWAAAAVATLGVSSCSLDMLPLNDVVLENFWTDKADVESVVASCYSATKDGAYINDMLVWGEIRSDNVDVGANISTALNTLMNGSMKTTNAYCDWSAMYTVINRCNTVLHYAPQVAAEDPNYTESDMNVNVAECKFLRAFSYLTLIKTFKNVPFTFEPSIDDETEYRIPQTSFEVILDELIKDIESCKDMAPRKYSEFAYNTGKVTRAAMYALLAELYLWRASDANLTIDEQKNYYTHCIEACDWVLRFKREQFQNRDTNGEDITQLVDENVWEIFGYPLLSDKTSAVASVATAGWSVPYAYYSLFGYGGSFESIFELPFRYNSTLENNGSVASMYGYTASGSNTIYQNVRASQKLMISYPTASSYDNSKLFGSNMDYRTLLSFSWVEGNSFNINKFVVQLPACNYTGSGTISGSVYSAQATTGLRTNQPRIDGSHYESWIIYRLAEVMLFRAEAEIELAALIDANAVPTAGTTTYRDGVSLVGSAADLYADAYNLLTAVYIRSCPATVTSKRLNTNAPALSQFSGRDAFETYLMNERRREFLFEGKRYYDLVRQARREGNTNKFSTALLSKFTGGAASLQMKMKMMDFMYMPVAKSQMKVNPNLVQNPAYADEEETVKN